MTIVAAVDCGTNSIRLLIARCGEGRIVELTRQTRLARLGQGVAATGRFHPDALERAFVILDEYAELIERHGVTKTRFVATSAARDVTNREVFDDGVRARLAVPAEVISGDEEARLSASGALGGLSCSRPALICDIGGGSTELVLVDEDDGCRSAVSLDVGAVRLKEEFLTTEPPTADEQAAARAHVGRLLDASGTDFAAARSTIAVAGTATSLAAEHRGLRAYSRDAVHGTLLSHDVIERMNRRWLAMTTDEIVEDSPLMPELRAAVIGAGSTILDEISARVPRGEIVVSETDILDGIVAAMCGEAASRRRRMPRPRHGP